MRYKDNIDKIEQQIADMVRDAPVERVNTQVRASFICQRNYGRD